MATLEDSLKTIVRTFRRECHRVLESERTTIHGADGMLMVLQLAIAEVNKQESGEFSVALSDVLMAWKHLLLDKLHLPLHVDSPRPENYDIIRKEYDSFLKRTNTMDLIDIHSMYKQLRVDPDPEEPLNSVQLFQFLSSNMETYEVEKVVRRVFCSYLDQLVNSKNDMALAHTLDTPNRSLGRKAFTDLKREARKQEHVTLLVQLGGKGYAPAESDPLRKHVKGLIAGVRLVTSIRAALLKGRASGDVVYAAADKTAKDLKERISQIHLSHRLQSASRTGISPARPRYHAINHATAYGGRETVKVLIMLLDEDALAPPCRNKADLLSADQAVLSGEEGTCMLTLFRSPEVPTGSSPKPLQHRVQERQDQLKPKDDSALPLNRVLDFPSTNQVPTCVHPALKRTLTTVESTSAVKELGRDSDRCPDPPSLPSPRTLPSPSLGTVEVDPEAGRKEAQRGGLSWGVAAALGPTSGNDAPSRRAGGGSRKTNIQTEGSSKACKRKLVDCSEHCGSENQPPLKKTPSSVTSTKLAGKKGEAKAPSKKKLIAGQCKLTSFFRL
ncbi:unnamed protein product [Coregonus sp. 'balchen']|nr:unnamed protein product [Coregonus sp. 'balchen']